MWLFMAVRGKTRAKNGYHGKYGKPDHHHHCHHCHHSPRCCHCHGHGHGHGHGQRLDIFPARYFSDKIFFLLDIFHARYFSKS